MSLLSAGGKRDLVYFAPAQGAQCQTDWGWSGDFGDGGTESVDLLSQTFAFSMQYACMSLLTALDFAPLILPIQEFVEGDFFAGELYVDEAKASFQQLGFKR